MKTTKFTICLLFIMTFFFTSSCKDGYDDSELTERVENLENRLQILEEQMNSNINSLQAILKALDNNDYITKVIPIKNGEKEIGYTINFSKGNSINIYHGQDGYSPQIGVKQDSDGIYYWTRDGEWMTDESGNKIKAQGSDGQDGQDGIKPEFKIENDYWFVSYNNGSTWEKLGKATGEEAKNFFQSVTVKETEVEFILSDGTTFVIPLKSKIEISFSSEDKEVGISEWHTVYVDYILYNANEKAIVTASSDGNFITKVIPNDINGGKISITSKNGATEGYINVMVSDGNGYTFINVINIFESRIEFSEGMEYNIGSKGGDIVIPFSINTLYTTKIVDNSSWISINPKSRADMHDETLNISVQPNTSNSERTAKIQLYNPSNEEDIFAEISITQYASYADAMILTALASSKNDYTVYLPEITGSNITINWGDGTQEDYGTTGYFSHKYSVSEPSNFDIKIIGDIKGLNSKDLNKRTITGIKQWGTSKLESMEYAFYKQPLEFIANDEFGALQNITSFLYTFSGCSSLTSIPQGLFDNCTEVTNFSYTFSSCYHLASIPQGLFDNCTEVTNFSYTFSSCFDLTSIPQELFDNCTEVTSFAGTFNGCSSTSLTSIPQGLFDNCTEVSSFESTFSSCHNLASIPQGLFDNCTKVTSFARTFKFCPYLTSIPQGLFDNCTEVTSFAGTFSGCSLRSIPQGLFDNCTEVTSFAGTFSDCSFSIPKGLFDNCTKVTNFSYTFEGCSFYLSFIPKGLFDNCTEVTDFSYTFYNCYISYPASIPSGLFDNCTKVTSFRSTFEGCSSIYNESPYTIIDGEEYHLYDRYKLPSHFAKPDGKSCFKGCVNLLGYSSMDPYWKN